MKKLFLFLLSLILILGGMCYAEIYGDKDIVLSPSPEAFERFYRIDSDNLVAHFSHMRGCGGWDAQQWFGLAPGDTSGVTQSTAAKQPTVYQNYRHFDGADDYMSQLVIDNEVSGVSYYYNSGASYFYEAGQTFTSYAGSGTATHAIYVTNADTSKCWGYIGAVTSGTTIEVYKDASLTTVGWLGVSDPLSGVSIPASYEVRVTDFNVTGDFSGFALVRFDDGQGAINGIFSKYIAVSNDRCYGLVSYDDGKIRFYIGKEGTAADRSSTNNAVIADDQTGWYLIGWSYDASVPNAPLYIDGSAVAITDAINSEGTETSIFDSSTPFVIGRWNTSYLAGDIAVLALFDDVLTAAEHLQIYNMLKWRFGL